VGRCTTSKPSTNAWSASKFTPIVYPMPCSKQTLDRLWVIWNTDHAAGRLVHLTIKNSNVLVEATFAKFAALE
jgi:hypothetical protein